MLFRSLWSGQALSESLLRQLTDQLPLTQFARIVTGTATKFGGQFSVVTSLPEFDPILVAEPQPALMPV